MEELELRQYWIIIRKRLAIVLSVPIIAAIASALVSIYVLKPQYAASTTLLVNQKPSQSQGIQVSDITASQMLVNTYSAIIKSRTLEKEVVQRLGIPYTAGQVNGMIKVSSPTQSQVIEVDVTAGNQRLAADIANSVASAFIVESKKLMSVENVQVVDPATASPKPSPVKPNKKLNVAIAFILGLMVSLGIAFLLEYLDNRIRTEQDAERWLKLPVMGTVMEYES